MLRNQALRNNFDLCLSDAVGILAKFKFAPKWFFSSIFPSGLLAEKNFQLTFSLLLDYWPHVVAAGMSWLKSQCHQIALRACVFVLKQHFAFGWRVCRNFRKLYRANWPFSELICTIVTSESRNIFIARCYWRKQLKIWIRSQRVWSHYNNRSIDRSIDLDVRKTRAAISTRYKNKTETSSKNIEVFIGRCHWRKLLKIWLSSQCGYMNILQSDRLIARSIASIAKPE